MSILLNHSVMWDLKFRWRRRPSWQKRHGWEWHPSSFRGTVVSPTSSKILSGMLWRFLMGSDHIVLITQPCRWGWRVLSSALKKRGGYLLSIDHTTRKLQRLTKEYNTRSLPTFVSWRDRTTSLISGFVFLLGVHQCGTQETILPFGLIILERWTSILVICCRSRTGVRKLNITCMHLNIST